MASEMMKSNIWVKTADGSIQQVEQEVAMLCPMIWQEVLKKKGVVESSKNYAIHLPEEVNPEMLSLIFDYCRFHLAKGRSDKELKNYDDNLIRRMDTKRLCEVMKAANSLQLEPLVELIGRALARIIEREKKPEEIREIFQNGLTEEEKLEPLENIMNDPTIRLLNKLNAKKREKLKSVAAVEEEHVEEERSVDDLLSFINGKDDDPKVVKKKTSKNEKKKNKKNKEKNGSTSTGTCEEAEKDSHNICSKSPSAEIVDKTESSLGDEIVDKTESSLGDEIADKTESSSLGDVSSMEDDSSTPNTDTGDDVAIAYSLWLKQKMISYDRDTKDRKA